MSTWIILAIATILRLILVNQSLWLDEAIEALALMGRQGSLLTYALADYQPPLYHFIGYGFTHLFGYSEFVLRLPSLIAGVLTVYFVSKIAEVFAGKKAAVVAGLLTATNPLLICYSQEGRTYALTACLAAAVFYYWLRLLTPFPRGRDQLYYFLSLTAMIWTSYLAWFFLLAQLIHSVLTKRTNILKLQLLSLLTLLVWLPSLLSSFNIGISTLALSPAWGRVVGALDWRSLPLTWVKFNLGRISFDSNLVYSLVVISLAAIHFVILRRLAWRKYSLLLWWLLPPVGLGLLMAAFLPVYSYFRLLFVLPAYLILLSLASFKARFAPTLIITAQLIALCIFWFNPRFHREDWRQVVQDLSTDDSAIAMPSLNQSAPLVYYQTSLPLIEPKIAVSADFDTIYYLRYAEELFDPTGIGPANLRASGYTMTKQRVYTGIQLDIYEHRN